jgi:hypothetical protein
MGWSGPRQPRGWLDAHDLSQDVFPGSDTLRGGSGLEAWAKKTDGRGGRSFLGEHLAAARTRLP